MKRPLLSFALALVSPFAFAQSSFDDGETENPVTPVQGDAATKEFDNGETENPVTTLQGNAATEEFSNGETENPVTPKPEATATTATDGFVEAFAAGEMISLATAEGGSMSFVIGPAVKYQDTAGQDLDESVVKEGSKVQVTAETNGDQLVAIRIVIDS